MNASSHLAIVLLAALAFTSVSANTASQSECPTTERWAAVPLISHETDCTKFYFCSNGNKIVSDCPLRDSQGNRLYFDVVVQACVWPRDTSCVSKTEESASSTESDSSESEESTELASNSENSSEEEENGSGSTSGPNSSSTQADSGGLSSTTEAEVVIPTECPATNEGNAVNIAHESDCGLFYTCNHGQKVLQQCPPGLSFNPALQVCDWPENAGCTSESSDGDESTSDENSTSSAAPESSSESSSSSGAPESSSESSSSSGASESSTESSSNGPSSSTESDSEISSSTTEAAVVIPTECPATNEGDAVHIAHESDCGLFYKCDHGQKVLQQCPPGLAFNPALQVCDWPDIVGCTPGSSDGDESSSAENSTSSAAPESSSESSSNGPSSSTESDSEISSSTTEAAVVIPTECPATNEGDAVHIAHESDCGLFYKCDHGKEVLQQCPAGLAFNPALQVCDWPDVVGCTPGGSDDSVQPTEDESSTSESSTSSWAPESSTEGSGEPSSSTNSDSEIASSTTEAEVVIPTECPATNEGNAVNIAHESDCGLFYVCNNGQKVLLQCPEGLEFNALAQVCDWPLNAQCSVGRTL